MTSSEQEWKNVVEETREFLEEECFGTEQKVSGEDTNELKFYYKDGRLFANRDITSEDVKKTGLIFKYYSLRPLSIGEDGGIYDQRGWFREDDFHELEGEAENCHIHFEVLYDIVAEWCSPEIKGDERSRFQNPEYIPDAVHAWMDNYILGKIQQPSKKKGRTKNFSRKSVLDRAAMKVIKKGYPAGRNHASDKTYSAYSIVEEACKRTAKNGFQALRGVKYETVRKSHEEEKEKDHKNQLPLPKRFALEARARSFAASSIPIEKIDLPRSIFDIRRKK